MDNNNTRKNNTDKNIPGAASVRTVYLDSHENLINTKNSVLGIFLLFFCIFAVCIGLILCVAQSFELDIDFTNIILVLVVSLVFFTLIYFLPSGLFTFIAFLTASGFAAAYVFYNFDYIRSAAYYTLNLCLYRISQAGYIIGGNLIDYALAQTVSDTTIAYVNLMAVFTAILFPAVFSFLVYARRNIVYSIVISVAVVFPGFFYGLIPGYFAFSLVAAFWVSQFAINIFESGYMEYKINKENSIPEKKLAKYKLKMFKKQYKRNVKSIKSEIRTLANAPNRNENFLRIDKLVRQLEAIRKNNSLFFLINGLNNVKGSKKYKNKKSKKEDKKIKNKRAEKFLNPVQIEKRRLKSEAAAREAGEAAVLAAAKKEFKSKTFSQRLKIKFAENIKSKKKYSVRGGYAGFFAFVIAFATVSAVQPFIAPDARVRLAMPETILHFMTSTVEYALVGSDSSVYGGYGGGMGGGFLYRPEGARFRDRPILRIQGVPLPRSGVVYLKGYTATAYTGTMWRDADRKQIEEYNNLSADVPLSRFNFVSERDYFKTFTETMQRVFDASHQRRNSELKSDSITIEHLVSGGRRSFLPYFLESYRSEDFGFRINADLNIEVTNSLFRFPRYAADFYSVDNILNRAMPYAVDDLREYLEFYESLLKHDTDIPEFFSLMDPHDLSTLLPEVRFFGERAFYNMGNRAFDRLNDEGNFYEYSAPGSEYADEIEYHGYIYVPYKYDTIIELGILKASYNIVRHGLGPYLQFNYTSSEIIYHNFAREHYLGIPENMPEEIAELALEITKDAVSDYDKALAVEKYIAENYTYTLSPAIPDNPRGDFVYNFLFEIEEGYCTAYASAMVMMMRTLGIPARYAEGYLVDTAKRQRDEDGNLFIIVYDYDGHAWPEVYLRGIGWVPFEPTVSYAEDPDAEAPPYIYNPPVRLPTEGSMFTPMTEPEWDDDDFGPRGGRAPEEEPVPPQFFVILAIISACVFVYVLNRVIISKRFRNFKTAGTNAAVMKMLAYMLLFLKYCGFVMHNEEGLKAFAKRVSPGFETITPAGWQEIAGIMQKARYSMHEITEEERESVYDFAVTLRQECLKRLKFNLKFKLRFVYFVL